VERLRKTACDDDGLTIWDAHGCYPARPAIRRGAAAATHDIDMPDTMAAVTNSVRNRPILFTAALTRNTVSPHLVIRLRGPRQRGSRSMGVQNLVGDRVQHQWCTTELPPTRDLKYSGGPANDHGDRTPNAKGSHLAEEIVVLRVAAHHGTQ